MSKECKNCGASVSERFYRVFYPDGADVNECIHCSHTRENGFLPPVKNEKLIQ